MDADVPKVPEKQVLIDKSDRSPDKDIEKINEMIRARKSRGGLAVSYGPIAAMALDSEWEDLGVVVIGGRPIRRAYKSKSLDCALAVNFRPRNHHKDNSAYLQNVTQKIGTLPASEWNKIPLFGAASNPRLFTVESVEVAELAGKKVIVMTGQHTGGKLTRAKHIYVSLSGDWKDSYDLAFGGSSDKEKFDIAVANFDKALKTVVWKPSRNPLE